MKISSVGLHVQINVELLIETFHEKPFHKLPCGSLALLGKNVPLFGYHVVTHHARVRDQGVDSTGMHEWDGVIFSDSWSCMLHISAAGISQAHGR